MKYYCDQFWDIICGDAVNLDRLHLDIDLADSEAEAVQLRVEFYEAAILNIKTRIIRLQSTPIEELGLAEIGDNMTKSIIRNHHLIGTCN